MVASDAFAEGSKAVVKRSKIGKPSLELTISPI